jgi:hypothetical protein
MTMSRRAGCAAFLCLLPSPAAAGDRAPAAPVALVYSLAGETELALPSDERRPLRLFDRLPAGAALAVGPGSRLALAFANGRRYELGERSRATLGRTDLAARSGPVRPLPAVPPLPRIAPVAEDGAGPRAGAVRIRGERITGLYPDGEATALARATTLHFAPVAGAGRYRIEVHDRQGMLVFAIETAASETRLPPGFLRSGRRYDWTVRTVERAGPVARGEAGLVTLDRRTTAAREALRRTVETSGDATLLALLADVDRRLGLWAEACDGLRTAVQVSGDPLLAANLAELECGSP